ncbi:MAG: hypothetical protein QUU85_17380 [Candidatus Eisenbacteria bacterium]|nr:hypothetical protein [Candidatus Eisenbacteria bacterium]
MQARNSCLLPVRILILVAMLVALAGELSADAGQPITGQNPLDNCKSGQPDTLAGGGGQQNQDGDPDWVDKLPPIIRDLLEALLP